MTKVQFSVTFMATGKTDLKKGESDVKKINLEKWQPAGDDAILLSYPDGKTLTVTKTDFDRAFGCIISASYDEVKRDFAINE